MPQMQRQCEDRALILLLSNVLKKKYMEKILYSVNQKRDMCSFEKSTFHFWMNIKKDHGENGLAALQGIRGDKGHLTITIQLDQIEIKEVGTHYTQVVTAKSRHPLEEGDVRLSKYQKRMDFALLSDMTRLRGNDAQVYPRLFAGTSYKSNYKKVTANLVLDTSIQYRYR